MVDKKKEITKDMTFAELIAQDKEAAGKLADKGDVDELIKELNE